MTDSSSTNDSFPPLVGSSSFMYFEICFNSSTAVYVYFGYTFLHIILLLPLSTSVLCWGYQQRSSAPVMSHCDYSTYIMAAMELVRIFGAALHIFSTFLQCMDLMFWGICIFGFPCSMQMFLPVLICLDRYLAVVFPISYIKLKQRAAVRIRNISTAVILMLCAVNMSYIEAVIKHPQISIVSACASLLCVVTVCFCSVSVLCVLIRPGPGPRDLGPGARGVARAQVDPVKRKAFNTIVIIIGVLLFKFAGNLACLMVSSSLQTADSLQCVIRASQPVFDLPSSLVLPLLFLHRNRKVPECKHTSAEDHMTPRHVDQMLTDIMSNQQNYHL